MRRPQLSTGAWLCTGLIGAAIIAPASVYAAVNSTVAIGNSGTGTVTATVTTNHQLLTTPISPKDVIHASAAIAPNNCATVYAPPAGKGVVVTNVTYDLGTGTAGAESYGFLTSTNCGPAYDYADTSQGYEAVQHTFPAGLPMPDVKLSNLIGSGTILITVDGYLIPAGQVPPSSGVRPAQFKHAPASR